jgi:hypothetical protein
MMMPYAAASPDPEAKHRAPIEVDDHPWSMCPSDGIAVRGKRAGAKHVRRIENDSATNAR